MSILFHRLYTWHSEDPCCLHNHMISWNFPLCLLCTTSLKISRMMFRRNIVPPSSVWRSKAYKKLAGSMRQQIDTLEITINVSVQSKSIHALDRSDTAQSPEVDHKWESLYCFFCLELQHSRCRLEFKSLLLLSLAQGQTSSEADRGVGVPDQTSAGLM